MLPPERVSDDRYWCKILPMWIQLRQVIDVVGHGVVTCRGPGGIAVPAQIGRNDVVVSAQIGGDPVPIAAVIAPAMQQDERRRVRIAPVHVVQSQTLGEIDARGRSGFRQHILVTRSAVFSCATLLPVHKQRQPAAPWRRRSSDRRTERTPAGRCGTARPSSPGPGGR